MPIRTIDGIGRSDQLSGDGVARLTGEIYGQLSHRGVVSIEPDAKLRVGTTIHVRKDPELPAKLHIKKQVLNLSGIGINTVSLSSDDQLAIDSGTEIHSPDPAMQRRYPDYDIGLSLNAPHITAQGTLISGHVTITGVSDTPRARSLRAIWDNGGKLPQPMMTFQEMPEDFKGSQALLGRVLLREEDSRIDGFEKVQAESITGTRNSPDRLADKMTVPDLLLQNYVLADEINIDQLKDCRLYCAKADLGKVSGLVNIRYAQMEDFFSPERGREMSITIGSLEDNAVLHVNKLVDRGPAKGGLRPAGEPSQSAIMAPDGQTSAIIKVTDRLGENAYISAPNSTVKVKTADIGHGAHIEAERIELESVPHQSLLQTLTLKGEVFVKNVRRDDLKSAAARGR